MPNKQNKDFFGNLRNGVVDKVESMSMPKFEPTGALEPVIQAVGDTHDITTIVNNQCNNKGGKSAQGAVILRNIIWDYDPIYFDFQNFREWPFKIEGKIIKRARIVGTATNLSDDGPVRTEILKWWPRGRYTEAKASKTYFSKYMTDNGWLIDVMTFDQAPKEFEGPLISFHWIDEPAKPDLVGAFLSRHMKGGVILFTQTPYKAAPMLDVLSDLKDKGFPVIKVSSVLDDNSITSGKLNSTGTKRGLMTDSEIDSYKKGCPPDQYDCRVLGKGSEKEGKIYKIFDPFVHVRAFDMDDNRFKVSNCYCALDFHEKYYPFVTWWAVFPPNDLGRCYHVCYNEWPQHSTFNDWYDNVRENLEFNMTIENFSKIIKILDGTQYGCNIVKRGIDPGFAKKSEIQLEFTKYNLAFTIPKREKIQTQRNKILTLMDYDITLGAVNKYTEPQWFIMPHCTNTARAFSRHYWEDKESFRSHKGKNIEVEADRYKDPVDTARIFESMLGKTEYIPILPGNRKIVKKSKPVNDVQDEYFDQMTDICLFKD